jgi:purine-binding chemotaxis protein CheW
MNNVGLSQGSQGDAPGDLHVVAFEHRGLLYALETRAVRRIIRLPLLTPVEDMPAYVTGVFNLRGSIVPVVDLGMRLGHPPRDYRVSDCVVLFEAGGRLAAVAADEVLEVRDAARTPLAGAAAETGPALRLFAGELDVGGRTAMLLNHDELFPETAAIDGATPVERAFLPDVTGEERVELQRRAHDLMHETGMMQAAGEGLAVVVLNGELYGVDLASVREFSEAGDPVPVPCCPPHVVGNTNLRGDIVTVMDVRGVLQLPMGGISRDAKIIVSEHDGQLLGVPVDEVLDVVYVERARYRKLPTAVREAEEYLLGEAPYGEKMLTVLDLRSIWEKGNLVVDEQV